MTEKTLLKQKKPLLRAFIFVGNQNIGMLIIYPFTDTNVQYLASI